MPKLIKDGHQVSTEVPSEIVNLKARGYAEVKPAPAPALPETTKPVKPSTTK